jgi:mannose-6-phosphate isomerase
LKKPFNFESHWNPNGFNRLTIVIQTISRKGRLKLVMITATGVETKIGALEYDRRPWGSYTVLDEGEGFKVKRIEVLPGKRLSYQKHLHRAEHWFIVQGTARVTLNDEICDLKENAAIDIAIGDKHRVENPDKRQTLIFIEVQKGDYLGEDDIVRFEDDYGRIQ